MTEASHEVQVVVAEGEGVVNGDFVAFQITASLQVFKVWNWDVGAEFRISIKKPGLQGLRP